MNLRKFSLLALIPILTVSASAQAAKTFIRFAAQILPPDVPKVEMVAAELISPPFDISAESFSTPQVAISRVFSLRAVGGKSDIVRVQLPENGTRFIVLLVVGNGGKVEPVVIPDNRAKFRAGDVHVHNSSGKLVLGQLGTTRFQLKPNSGGEIRPAGIVDNQYYEVRFAYEDGGAARMFSSARWPAGLNERSYVFFYTDQRNPERILYRVISEVLHPEKEGK